MKLHLIIATAATMLFSGVQLAQADKAPREKVRDHRKKAKAHRKDARDHRKDARKHEAKSNRLEKRADRQAAKGHDKRAKVLDKRADRQDRKAHRDHRRANADHRRANVDRAKAINTRLKATKNKKHLKLLKRAHVRANFRARARAERRAEERKRARARGWVKIVPAVGAKAPKPHPKAKRARKEFKRHARRLAWLNRILDLAVDAEDYKTAARAEMLLEKENKRHAKWVSVHLSVKTN